MQLSQSTILVGAVLAAFVVYLAIGNRLNAYWAILTGAAASPPATGTPSPGSTGPGAVTSPGLSGSPGPSIGSTTPTTGLTGTGIPLRITVP